MKSREFSYLFEFVGLSLGVNMVEVPPDQASLCYGESRSAGAELFVLRGLRASGPLEVDSDGNLSFDIFEEIAEFLLDKRNKTLPCDLDKHGRVPYSHLAQGVHLGLAPVNQILLKLKQILKQHLGIRCLDIWPEGKKCAVVLTHDVDHPINVRPFEVLKEIPKLLLRPNLRSKFKIPRKIIKSGFAALSGQGYHWAFDHIIKAESAQGFRSTFFFASRTDEEGHSLDVEYEVSEDRFRRLFKQLSALGFEIGLHASYLAYRTRGAFQIERTRLEEAAQTSVRGLRHHFWHMSVPFWNTLGRHFEAGFEYDASVAFNDHPGFRLGTGLPFFPWDPIGGKKIGTLQIPTVVMDGAVFDRPAETKTWSSIVKPPATGVAEGLEKLQDTLDKLADCSGVGAVDWHVRMCWAQNKRFSEWGECYELFLKELGGRSDIWVATCSEITNYWRERADKLRHGVV
ncbi:MAG: hypothetical protein AB7J86_40315 [Vulcanimicrobiota bacterium]